MAHDLLICMQSTDRVVQSVNLHQPGARSADCVKTTSDCQPRGHWVATVQGQRGRLGTSLVAEGAYPAGVLAAAARVAGEAALPGLAAAQHGCEVHRPLRLWRRGDEAELVLVDAELGAGEGEPANHLAHLQRQELERAVTILGGEGGREGRGREGG